MRPEAAGSNPRLQLAQQSPAGLQHGQLVQARVLKALTDTKWLLAIGGRVYPATSEVGVRPGQVLAARVHLEAGRVFLQLTERLADSGASGRAGPVLERLGLPQDERAAQLLRAFMREGLALDSERFTRIHRVAGRLGIEQLSNLRLLVILDRKGFGELIELWTQIQHLFSGIRDRDRNQDQERRRRHGGGRERREGRKAGAVSEDSVSAVGSGVADSGESGRLARELRTQMRRSVDEPDHVLQLFNHSKDRRSPSEADSERRHWVMIPLELERLGTRYTGSARLLLDVSGGFSRAAVLLHGGGRSWGVEWWNTPATSRRVDLYVDDADLVDGAHSEGGTVKAAWQLLRSRLQEQGIGEINLSVFPVAFDGFSSDGDNYIMQAVKKDL